MNESLNTWKSEIYLENIKSLEHRVLALESRIINTNLLSDWTMSLCHKLQFDLNEQREINERMMIEHKKWERMNFKQ